MNLSRSQVDPRRSATAAAAARRPSELPTINIVEDDVGFRIALSELFRSAGHEVRQFGDANAFMASGKATSPGCLVLDIQLPHLNGLDFQAQLSKSGIHMPVILMSGQGDIPMSVRGMKAGAIDFLPKPFEDSAILAAVAAALLRDADTRMKHDEMAGLRERFDSLSSREREVLTNVVEGQMNKQIAFKLSISEVTVKIHRGNVMRKMGARTFAALVRMTEVLRNHSQSK
ncbi:response regulator transcription factor [Bradyrhizobium sp. NBAIM08]|nr:response regulator transcription factor [Bradyrhizobium sp. NBAIM08]